MKKHANIALRAQQLEKKHGVYYHTADGKLFKYLRLSVLLVYIYKLLMNLIYIAGAFFMLSAENMSINVGVMTAVCASTAVMIAGAVAIYLKSLLFKFAGLVGLLVAQPMQLAAFAQVMRNGNAIRSQFYWMHLIPAVIILLLSAWMLYIIIHAEHIKNFYYKKVVSNLYAAHHSSLAGDGSQGVSDEEWEEFLKNYDPSDYKKQF